MEFHGGGGIMNYNRSCRLRFPESRMCTSTEVMETSSVEAGIYGWIRPVIVGVDAQGNVYDVSGISAAPSETLTCQGWFNYGPNNSGLAMANYFWFNQEVTLRCPSTGCVLRASCRRAQPVTRGAWVRARLAPLQKVYPAEDAVSNPEPVAHKAHQDALPGPPIS